MSRKTNVELAVIAVEAPRSLIRFLRVSIGQLSEVPYTLSITMHVAPGYSTVSFVINSSCAVDSRHRGIVGTDWPLWR